MTMNKRKIATRVPVSGTTHPNAFDHFFSTSSAPTPVDVTIVSARGLSPAMQGIIEASIKIGAVTVHGVHASRLAVVWPSRFVDIDPIVTVDDATRKEAERLVLELAAEFYPPIPPPKPRWHSSHRSTSPASTTPRRGGVR